MSRRFTGFRCATLLLSARVILTSPSRRRYCFWIRFSGQRAIIRRPLHGADAGAAWWCFISRYFVPGLYYLRRWSFLCGVLSAAASFHFASLLLRLRFRCQIYAGFFGRFLVQRWLKRLSYYARGRILADLKYAQDFAAATWWPAAAVGLVMAHGHADRNIPTAAY